MVDLKQCIVCTTDDIDECHEACKAKMRRDRESGERSGDQLEPWEHREINEEKAADKLADKLTRGCMSHRKYLDGLRKLREEGHLYDDDYNSDLEYGGS